MTGKPTGTSKLMRCFGVINAAFKLAAAEIQTAR